jgi:hypothetical protein
MTENQIRDFKNDYDWKEAIGFAPFGMAEIEDVIAMGCGANDEDSWVAVFRLSGDRFGYVDAWCDYTGWDCRSGGNGGVRDNLADLQRFEMTSQQRRRLGMELPDLDDVPNRKHGA